MIDKQPTRQEQIDDGIESIPEQQDEPEVTSINAKEFLEITDVRLGLKIGLGSSVFGANDLCSWAIQLKNDWNKNPAPKTKEKERTYYG